MDIQTLRIFVAVAREGNLSRAADKLALTQPAVSLQIKGLQAATGLTLFTRGAQGMNLTRDGAALLPLAERVLSAQGDFKNAAARMHTQVRGRLRIGTILDPEFTRLGRIFEGAGRNRSAGRDRTASGHERRGAGADRARRA